MVREGFEPERANYGGPIGPPAMINCELRQARKGATVAIDSCAGMWLVGLPPFFYSPLVIRGSVTKLSKMLIMVAHLGGSLD